MKIDVIMHTYAELTEGVLVEVKPAVEEEYSFPDVEEFMFSYEVTITNNSLKTIQLLNRHWIITDGEGHREEVKGPGVVGEQPVLEPKDTYTYQSFCPLPTPTGNMRGRYEMKDEKGRFFEVTIPLFFLRHEEIFQ